MVLRVDSERERVEVFGFLLVFELRSLLLEKSCPLFVFIFFLFLFLYVSREFDNRTRTGFHSSAIIMSCYSNKKFSTIPDETSFIEGTYRTQL